MVQNGQPTLAGLLLLGHYPQEFYPQLSLTALAVQGKEIGEIGEDGARFIDNKRIEGSIDQILEGTLSFVQRNIKTKTIIRKDGRRFRSFNGHREAFFRHPYRPSGIRKSRHACP